LLNNSINRLRLRVIVENGNQETIFISKCCLVFEGVKKFATTMQAEVRYQSQATHQPQAAIHHLALGKKRLLPYQNYRRRG
jgi:hypothetical protein